MGGPPPQLLLVAVLAALPEDAAVSKNPIVVYVGTCTAPGEPVCVLPGRGR